MSRNEKFEKFALKAGAPPAKSYEPLDLQPANDDDDGLPAEYAEQLDMPAYDPPAPSCAGAPVARSGQKLFKPKMLRDIILGDEPLFLVDGLLPAGPAFGMVVGSPKTLKSFLLVHVGLHIATDRIYAGRAVQSGLVIYITNEGTRGAEGRLIAARQEMNLDEKDVPFALITDMPNLGGDAADRDALKAQIEAKAAQFQLPVRLIIIDTLRRATPGKSENKPEDMSIAVGHAEYLSHIFQCLSLFVHHAPRQATERSSGTNSLDAACDVMIAVTRQQEGAGSATAKVLYMKDGHEGDEWTFEVRSIDIGIDRAGKTISAGFAYLLTEPAPSKSRAVDIKLSTDERRVYEILVKAIAEAGKMGTDSSLVPPTASAITRDLLKGYLKNAGWWDESDNKTNHSSRSKCSTRLNKLAGKGVIGLTYEHVWVVRNLNA